MDGNLPATDLEELSCDIYAAIKRRDDALYDWAEATLDLCVKLAQARRKFPSDQAFGDWCKRFELSHQDRAAAVQIGRLSNAMEILQRTERRSLRLIYEDEVKPERFTSAGKPEKDKEEQRLSSKSTPTPKHEPEVEKAKAVFDEIKQQGKEPTITNIVEEARSRGDKIGKNAASTAKAIRETEERIREETRVEARREVEDEEYFVRVYIEKLDEVLKMLRWPQHNVMHKAEYNKLRMALHPDTRRLQNDEQLDEAFRILQKYEAKMVSEEPERKLSSALPRTREEMMERRNGRL